jgi:hypothetical protein
MKLLPAVCVVLLGFIGCRSSSVANEPKWVEFGLVVHAPKEGAATETRPYFGLAHAASDHAVLVSPLLRCRVHSVSKSSDTYGFPAVTVELDKRDKPKFEEFSGAHVHEELAVIVDGKVVSRATISEKLPGTFALSGRFTEAEVEALKRSLE